ncbi:MAG: hypothetical protein RBU21_23000, partial [FCB group bacterium]|jgi:hypothetical protein|nr:hypothetical protein [FCB group bacterium]
VLKALDRIGMPRVLRSVSDAADRDISQGRGLRSWCFERGPNRDAGLFVASRLARQPFIDGRDGLMARAEGPRVLETQACGELVYGLGLGALEGRPVALLSSSAMPNGRQVQVQVLDASTDPIAVTNVAVYAYARSDEVAANALVLQQLMDSVISNGQVLLDSLADAFPLLRVGPRAWESFAALSGSEPVFRQLIRHLRALNSAAEGWVAGTPYRPEGITFSHESDQTLLHGRFGPVRDFPAPEGFEHERWSLHTKLTGGGGARLYFRAVRTAETKAVLIGYFGAHLPCVLYPT